MLDCMDTFLTVFIAQTCMYCNACKAVYKHEICGQTFSRLDDERHDHCNRKLPILQTVGICFWFHDDFANIMHVVSRSCAHDEAFFFFFLHFREQLTSTSRPRGGGGTQIWFQRGVPLKPPNPYLSLKMKSGPKIT